MEVLDLIHEAYDKLKEAESKNDLEMARRIENEIEDHRKNLIQGYRSRGTHYFAKNLENS